jgi:hypothetical protein
MKNKFLLLGTIISSCLLAIVCNQSTADEMHSHMQQGGKWSCPNGKCPGDANIVGYGYGGDGNTKMGFSTNNTAPSATKVLQTGSTQKVEGMIKSVNRVTFPNQTQIQLVLEAPQGDLLVTVGPACYVDYSKVKLNAGDKVNVIGYQIYANGKEVMIAAQIQKNGFVLQLLNENRQPVWASQAPCMPCSPCSGTQCMSNSRY